MPLRLFGRLNSLRRFIFDVALRWYHGRIGDLAAGVTFWFLISLPALILAFLAILGPVDSFLDVNFETEIKTRVEEFLNRVFTDNSGEIKQTVISLFDQSNPGLFTFSLGLALWSVSRGFAGMIRALEDIYGIEDGRPWYYTRMVALVLGFGTMMISIPMVLLEQTVWADIDDGLLRDVARYASIAVGLVLWASVILYFGPAQRHRWRDDLPGALVASILWCVLYFGFSRFVAFTAGANDVQTAVGAGLLALTWIWFAAQALLIGGAVNFLYGERRGVKRNFWNLNEKIAEKTGEFKKVVVAERP